MDGLFVLIGVVLTIIMLLWMWGRRRFASMEVHASWGRVAPHPRWRRALSGLGRGLGVASIIALVFGVSTRLIGWPGYWLVPAFVAAGVVAFVVAWVRLPERVQRP